MTLCHKVYTYQQTGFQNAIWKVFLTIETESAKLRNVEKEPFNRFYRVPHNGLTDFRSLECQQKLSMGLEFVICTYSLGLAICFFTFRMDFELIGWPPQPQIFSSSSTKITKKNAQFRTSVLTCWRLCRLSFKFKIHSKGKKTNVHT